MSALMPFVGLEEGCDLGRGRVTRELEHAGFRMVQTFDLQVARLAHPGCPCPHHGTEQCNCQMIVLLIYRDDNSPTTLVLHGQDGRTWVSLVSVAGERTDPRLEGAVRRALAASMPEGASPAEVACEARSAG